MDGRNNDMKRKYPNLYVIGAPKCGTTSLHYWLSSHPDIFMSPIKEPYYWVDDFNISTRLGHIEYFGMFKDKVGKYKYIGESSTIYLLSSTAVKNIENNIDNPKYIVIIRNPVDMAISAWRYSLKEGGELEKDFMKAFHLSERRRKGEFIKVNRTVINDPRLLDYKFNCSLGTHLERLYRIVNKSRVLVLVLDDIIRDPRREYIKILNFLDVADDGRKEFPIYNESSMPKNLVFSLIYKMLVKINYKTFKFRAKIGLANKGILSFFSKYLLSNKRKEEVDESVRMKLIDFFESEINKIENLLRRDFSEWKQK